MNPYLAEALGVSCSIVRPLEGILDSKAASCTSSETGGGSSRAEDFSFEGMLSCRAAYSEVGTSFDECHNVYTSYSISVIEGLDIAGMVTADRIVSRTVSESPALDNLEGEWSFDITGSHFENLRVAGYRIDLQLSTQTFHELDTYAKLKNALKRGRQDLLPYSRLAQLPSTALDLLEDQYPGVGSLAEAARKLKARDSRPEGSLLWCTAAGHLNLQENIGNTELRNFGGVIFIPKFGLISLGELLIEKLSRRLIMLRLELGSPLEGRFSVGSSAQGATGWSAIETPIEAKSSHLPEKHALESQRFTDLTLLRGHVYARFYAPNEARIADEEPLAPGGKYTLEVAIRQTRTGVNADRDAPRAVKSRRRNREEIKVYVSVSSNSEVIELDEPLAELVWPYDSDSGSALFHLTVKRKDTHEPQQLLEVRLFDSNLDLLDVIEIFVTVKPVGHKRPLPKHRLAWPDESPQELRVDANSRPRQLSINISALADGFKFEFVFKKENGEVSLWASPPTKHGDIESLLERVRDFWTKLVITTYADLLTVAQSTWDENLRELAKLGKEARRLLFGDRAGTQSGAAEVLGSLWTTMALDEDIRIQIAYGSGTTDFIFPWSIVYEPRKRDDTTVDPFLFWGARYQIEQVRKGPPEESLKEEDVLVTFSLDPSFEKANSHRKIFEPYKGKASGKLTVTEPISDAKSLFDQLLLHPSAHLYYFFCHGYAPASAHFTRCDGLKQIRHHIDGIKDEEGKKTWQSWLSLEESMKGEASMFLGMSEVRESELREQEFFSGRRPVVFLNMCHSADLVPSMTSGLVNIFLERDASAVLGTECVMTSVFAHEFAQQIFNDLFAHRDVGTALWNARRHFIDHRNPLGLAYTLYGRATVRLV
jgi:hypothetical protein